MKKMSKKAVKYILCFMFLLIVAVGVSVTASIQAHAVSNVNLDYLMEKFPHGKYWNHVGMYENNPDGWTDTPCPHVLVYGDDFDYYVGIGTCNSFGGDVQCVGFVNKLVYDAYGDENYLEWQETTLDELKPGDVVRFKYDMHTIFITSVDGENVTYGECNGDYDDCQIRWNVPITKSEIAESLTAVFSAPDALSVPLANHSSVSADEVLSGDEVIFQGIGEGGDETYTYEFSVLVPKADSYTVIQEYSEVSSVSYFPTELGQYQLKVDVKDSTGQTATRLLDFTVITQLIDAQGQVVSFDFPNVSSHMNSLLLSLILFLLAQRIALP